MEESKVFENENEFLELVQAEATDVETEDEGSGFETLALVGGVIAGLIGLGALVVKKVKDKKAGKPKVKKRLKWVEVPECDVVDVEESDIEEDIEESE